MVIFDVLNGQSPFYKLQLIAKKSIKPNI